MIIKGMISYEDGSVVKVTLNSEGNFGEELDTKTRDAVSYALFGKTAFHDIIDLKKGPPLIIFSIESKGKEICIVRKPQYLRETPFGSRYLEKDICSIKTEAEEYNSLNPEEYYKMLEPFLDISYDDFTAVKC